MTKPRESAHMNRKCDDPTHEWETMPTRRCRTCRQARARMSSEKRRQRRREGALDAYGRTCRCCGESNPRSLAIVRIDRGAVKRRGFYRWLESEGYPPGFRTLCQRCNQAKHIYGGCLYDEDR